MPVDLWFWPLDRPPAEIAARATHLTEAERARAASFHRPSDGDRFRVGRGRMREILSGYAGTAPRSLAFAETGRGKPVLRDGPAFNLSHSGGWAALAVAPSRADLALGIDIEAPRPVEPALARRVLSVTEYRAFRDLPVSARTDGFFGFWTCKEAVIKATGDGFGVDTRDFDVALGPPARVLACRCDLPPARDWALVTLDTGPGMFGALAAVTGGGALGPLCLREGTLPLSGGPPG